MPSASTWTSSQPVSAAGPQDPTWLMQPRETKATVTQGLVTRGRLLGEEGRQDCALVHQRLLACLAPCWVMP